MGRWLVSQQENQFAVDSLSELERLASAGKLVAGDLIQPPGSTSWLYANEVPELRSKVPNPVIASEGSRLGLLLGGGAVIGFVALVAVGSAVWSFARATHSPMLIGDDGLSYSQMVVTAEQAGLRGEPTSEAAISTPVAKEEIVELLAKRGDFYKARTESGQEGWILMDQVIPIYQFGDRSVIAKYDPLYNPNRYVDVGSASWTLVEGSDSKTQFRFQMSNDSPYPMTGLKLVASVRDGKGVELDRVEFEIEGEIPPLDDTGDGSTFVGTLKSAPGSSEPVRLITEYSFKKLAKEQPALQSRWSDVVEVDMKNREFLMAEVKIIEVRSAADTI